MMRRYTGRLLECPRKVVQRQPRNAGERRKIDVLAELRFYVFAYPAHGAGWKTAACLRCRRELPHIGEQIGPRAGVQIDARRALPNARSPLGGSHQRRPSLVAPGDDEQRRDIARILPPKKRAVLFKEVPQADTGAQRAIVEQERSARGSVCADNALAAIDGEQHACGALVRRRNRDDPLSTELLPEKPFLYGARRRHRKGACQRMRSFRPVRIDRGDIQDRDQSSIDIENRRARTTEIYVSRSIMLASVDGY